MKNNTNNPEEKKYEVCGYSFSTKEAFEQAKDEMKAIKKLSDKTNMKNESQVYSLYNTLLDKEYYRTQVGLNYIKSLQQFLYVSKSIPNDTIRPIPVRPEVQDVIDGRKEVAGNRSVINKLEREKEKYKDHFIKSLIVNIFLVIAIIVIVYITVFSTNANILNYENNLQNKYSSWEEQLKQKETQLKQKEAQLNQKN